MQFIAMKFLPIPSGRWLPLSAETVPRAFTTKQVPDIPLHLIPKTIADLIKGRRRPLYRITARKMFRNRYTLTIETRKRRYRRFAQPGCLTPDPAGHEGIHSGKENH
jgi:hypothetical protein